MREGGKKEQFSGKELKLYMGPLELSQRQPAQNKLQVTQASREKQDLSSSGSKTVGFINSLLSIYNSIAQYGMNRLSAATKPLPSPGLVRSTVTKGSAQSTSSQKLLNKLLPSPNSPAKLGAFEFKTPSQISSQPDQFSVGSLFNRAKKVKFTGVGFLPDTFY